MSAALLPPLTAERPGRRPRLGFLGVGWIGRHRLEAVVASGLAEVTAIADAAPDRAQLARAAAPSAEVASDLEALLERDDLDGVVIATPSARHAEESVAALERGLAVFCQKPLGRDAREVRRVVEAARAADRLLGVDLSYRFTDGMQKIRESIRTGALGEVYAAELVFHNAYGPDKPWFYDRQLSGGGCLIDLGVHLVDLALWALDFPSVVCSSCRLLAAGRPLARGSGQVEDYATARLDLEGGAVVQLACSWRLPAGCEAVIGAAFYGTRGGAALRNLGGSFYDFRAEAFAGTERRPLSEPPDAWGGRAAVEWARCLARGNHFEAESERLVQVAEVLDGLYADGVRPVARKEQVMASGRVDGAGSH